MYLVSRHVNNEHAHKIERAIDEAHSKKQQWRGLGGRVLVPTIMLVLSWLGWEAGVAGKRYKVSIRSEAPR